MATTIVQTIPYNPEYPIGRTSVFINGLAKIKLGRTVLSVKREDNKYELLAQSSDGSRPVITQVTLDDKDRLIGVSIGGAGPLSSLGCCMIADAYTEV